jgi:hypothetical protein
MDLIELLRHNKGTVSSQLGKELARRYLAGETAILAEAVGLASFSALSAKEKGIRAGAAKLIECVAEERPEAVAPFLEQLLPALGVKEPQTRWMILRTFGFCAARNPATARKALPFARAAIREKRDGQLCLVSSADLYLGDFGALSPENAAEVYPLLLESVDNVIMNEHDWLIEAFARIAGWLDQEKKAVIRSFADEYRDHPRKTTQERVKKLLALCQ